MTKPFVARCTRCKWPYQTTWMAEKPVCPKCRRAIPHAPKKVIEKAVAPATGWRKDES